MASQDLREILARWRHFHRASKPRLRPWKMTAILMGWGCWPKKAWIHECELLPYSKYLHKHMWQMRLWVTFLRCFHQITTNELLKAFLRIVVLSSGLASDSKSKLRVYQHIPRMGYRQLFKSQSYNDIMQLPAQGNSSLGSRNEDSTYLFLVLSCSGSNVTELQLNDIVRSDHILSQIFVFPQQSPAILSNSIQLPS